MKTKFKDCGMVAATHEIHKLQSDLAALRQQNEALREGLRKVEWSKNVGFCINDDATIRANAMGCPACNGVDVRGHGADCWLAKLLTPKEGE